MKSIYYLLLAVFIISCGMGNPSDTEVRKEFDKLWAKTYGANASKAIQEFTINGTSENDNNSITVNVSFSYGKKDSFGKSSLKNSDVNLTFKKFDSGWKLMTTDASLLLQL